MRAAFVAGDMATAVLKFFGALRELLAEGGEQKH